MSHASHSCITSVFPAEEDSMIRDSVSICVSTHNRYYTEFFTPTGGKGIVAC